MKNSLLVLEEYYYGYDRNEKELVTLEHLLTMTSGFSADEVPGLTDRETSS